MEDEHLSISFSECSVFIFMSEKRRGVRMMSSAYSSYHGKVHNARISVDPPIYSGYGALMNSVCAGHVVSGDSYSNKEDSTSKLRQQDADDG